MICAVDKERDKNKRLRLEEAWMILLDTLNPKGLPLHTHRTLNDNMRT